MIFEMPKVERIRHLHRAAIARRSGKDCKDRAAACEFHAKLAAHAYPFKRRPIASPILTGSPAFKLSSQATCSGSNNNTTVDPR